MIIWGFLYSGTFLGSCLIPLRTYISLWTYIRCTVSGPCMGHANNCMGFLIYRDPIRFISSYFR